MAILLFTKVKEYGVSFHIWNAVVVGKDQVSVGIVALDSQHRSSQSAKSVFPLAIANCKEKRLVEYWLGLFMDKLWCTVVSCPVC